MDLCLSRGSNPDQKIGKPDVVEGRNAKRVKVKRSISSNQAAFFVLLYVLASFLLGSA